MKQLIKEFIQKRLGEYGYTLHRFDRDQVVPGHLPDPDLYSYPEDYSRTFRPWHGKEYDRFFTPGVTQNTMLSRKKLYILLKLFSQTLNLDGDVFEAGVGSGGSSRLMLDRLLEAKIKKKLWLLDTFEGYQKVDSQRDGAHVKVNQCRCSGKEEVAELLRNDQIEVNLIKGLIPATLEEVKTDKISFAHIDVNLYEPSVSAIDFCLKRMAPGAVMLFDDYCWPATYGTRKATDEVCDQWKQHVMCIPESTQAFLIKT